MAYEVTIEARYPRDADTVFAEALNFAELREAMRGLARYDGLPDGVAYEGQSCTVDVTLFGILRNPGHHMHVERLDRAARILQSREHNPSVRRWDHTLSVQPEGTGCLWTDRVVIDADRLAWGTARFARFVYTRRHRHRGALSIARTIRRV
ncbi:MAG: hypothetical protein KDK10_10750 [Maritimibacter sp.]|nr:hypothetical protein [Maritimibacter sp.]